MSDPVPFLTAFGHAIAAMGLYADGHPARRRAVVSSLEELRDLAAADPAPQFTFLGGEVVYRRRLLRELPRWEWASRLPGIGIERIEFPGPITAEEYQGLLEEAHRRLQGHPPDPALARQLAPAGIRFGPVVLSESAGDPLADAAVTAAVAYSLKEEAEAILWMHDQVQHIGTLPIQEADVVVRSLAFAMHTESRMMLPLLRLKEFDEYTTTHASNVAVLAMGLAEYVGLGSREVRAIGVAGLLHDLGKVRIPKEILVKPGLLTDRERTIIQQHPANGARIILDCPQQLDLAAVVAYEHHLWLAGGGYPLLRFERDTHYVSRLVHVCDVYDALCTDRPYRGALDSESALALIEAEVGTSFDPELTRAFSRLIREASVQRVPAQDPVVSVRT